MLYIKDMNLVEILILSQSETKGQFNAFPHKEESEGSVHQTRFIKCSSREERNGKIQKAAELVQERKASARPGCTASRLPSTLSWRLARAIRGPEMDGREGKSLSVARIVLNVSSPGRSRRAVASETPLRAFRGQTPPWGGAA